MQVFKILFILKTALLLLFVVLSVKQASSFFIKNLTNADNDNNINISTKMEMSLVNEPANNV